MRLSSLILFSALALCFSCSGKTKDHAEPGAGGIQKIPVDRDQVFDLSGYADEGKGDPFNLFDENAYVDPRYPTGGEPYVPVTNCQPTQHQAIYFTSGRGNRIVTDLLVPYALKEIYIYDRSGTNDSVWIYAGTLKKWQAVAAWETVSDPGARGWKKFGVDVHTRFVMIRFSSYETNISEMVLYGTPLETRVMQKPGLVPDGFTKNPLNRFLGVNYIMEKEARWLKPFHFSRLYNFALDYDNDTVHRENDVQFNMLHYGYYDAALNKYVFDIDTLQRVNQGTIWFSIRGVSQWMSNLGLGDNDRPLNRPRMNTEDPASYSRHAHMMWNLAAFFGQAKVDTSLMSISNRPRQSGRGSMSLFENGNEEDAWWVGNKYCNPLEYYAQSTADWDGDEGRLGKNAGIRNADPQARLMTSGVIGLDTNRIKVYRFLSDNLRNDQQFPWQGGIQYHYYCNRNGHGISPEADSLRHRLTLVRRSTEKTAPGVPCILGENGYDKGQASRQSTPVLPGYSAAESQGIMLLRSINATFFSGFDAYILFWLKDGGPPDAPDVYATSGILRQMPDGKTIAYPAWYYISTLVGHLGNYVPDSVISEKGPVWIYRYRNQQVKDSIAYFVYAPTVSGTKIAQYAFRPGNAEGADVREVSFLADSEGGREEKLVTRQGVVQVPVDEKPRLLLCRELHPKSFP